MSRDILELIQEMNPQGLKRQVVMQCSPLITGLKVSNLLTIPKSAEEEMTGLLADTYISWYVLMRTAKKSILLLYRERELREYLMDRDTRELLWAVGYENLSFDEMLEEMRDRYQAHRLGRGAFPHEMGLFLGYPAADVRGFMENGGQDFLYCGYWKVYEGVEEKKRIFRKYEAARAALLGLLHGGLTLADILEAYGGGSERVAV